MNLGARTARHVHQGQRFLTGPKGNVMQPKAKNAKSHYVDFCLPRRYNNIGVWYRAGPSCERGPGVQGSATEVKEASSRRRSGNNSQGKLFLRRRLLSERLSVYDRVLFRPGAQSEGQTATPEIKAITGRSRGSEAMNGQSMCRSAGSDSL